MRENIVKSRSSQFVYKGFQDFRELFEMLLSECTPETSGVKAKANLTWSPPIDAFETDAEFVVIMDIAGMALRDIGVFTDGSILTIQGVREGVTPSGRKQFHSMEIHVGPFQRLVRIPVPVESEGISANYSNGFLEVRLRRKFEGKRRRKIKVE